MKKKKILKVLTRIWDVLMTFILIGLTTASICGVAFAMYINEYIVPKAELELANLALDLTSMVYYYDENGVAQELETLHGEQNRIWADFNTIPQYLKDAFVSIEDERFYTHEGVDWFRTVGAAVNWVLPIRESGFGGSTITQQLIKNSTGDNDYSISRKITEILRALNLEKKMEKDDILELYLNTIYLGRTAYGVNTAAQTYFGKELGELNLAECAVIAGITNNPSYYDPFRYPENIKKRQETILNMMYTLDKISKNELDQALAYELDYKLAENEQKLASTQSYFVDAVIEDVLNDLMERKGYSKQVATQLLFSGGLEIYATVDMSVQSAMETVYEDESNFPNISGKDGALPESSMVIIDPNNGQVKGIIGGRGEKSGDRILNRATQTTRSPGSSIKPVAVYAPAIDAGIITPASVYTDSPYDFSNGSYGWPKNSYSGFRGQVTIYEAVEDSINTIAVKVLEDLGTRESYNFVTSNLGLDLVESRTMSSGRVVTDIALSPLALGGLTDGVSTLEMAASYVPFANDGVFYEPITYTKVVDSQGNVILTNNVQPIQAFSDPDTVFYMRQLLERVVSSGTGYGAKVSGMDTLGKTGTTNSNYDRWFVGATPYYVGATWFGYDVQQNISGVWTNPARSLWSDVMDIIHTDLPNAKFTDPTNFVSVSYCLDSGHLPSEYCSQDVRGSRVAYAYLASGDKPTETCSLHVPVEIDILNGYIATEYCPTEYVNTRVLLDLTRVHTNAVYLPDEQYTVSLNNAPVGKGDVRASRTTSSTTATTYTDLLCELHDHTNAYESLGYVYDFETGLWYDPETGEIYDPYAEALDEENELLEPNENEEGLDETVGEENAENPDDLILPENSQTEDETTDDLTDEEIPDTNPPIIEGDEESESEDTATNDDTQASVENLDDEIFDVTDDNETSNDNAVTEENNDTTDVNTDESGDLIVDILDENIGDTQEQDSQTEENLEL